MRRSIVRLRRCRPRFLFEFGSRKGSSENWSPSVIKISTRDGEYEVVDSDFVDVVPVDGKWVQLVTWMLSLRPSPCDPRSDPCNP